MKKYILLIITLLSVLPLKTHPVDLPYTTGNNDQNNPKTLEQESLKKILKTEMLSHEGAYSVLCALSAVLREKGQHFFKFPSTQSEQLYKEIDPTYQNLKNEDPKKADAYLGWALIELVKRLRCFSSRTLVES